MSISAVLSTNFEVNAFIYDVETALQMREIFLQDQRDSVQGVPEKLGEASLASKGRRKRGEADGAFALTLNLKNAFYLKNEKFTLP